MLYNIIVGYNSSWYFVLYTPSAWVIPPLHHSYIYFCINMFVKIISIFTAIYLCNSYYILLGCNPYWEYCHTYFLYNICCYLVEILVYLYSQKWINISLFVLVVTCIEAHIFVPSFSIYHIFISTMKFFCCFLLLGQLFNLNLQHSKTRVQNHVYAIFEII